MIPKLLAPCLLVLLLPRPCAGDTAAPWSDASHPFRARITVPAEPTARAPVCAEMRLDLDRDLAALGLPSNVELSSLRLLEQGADNAPREVAVERREGALVWPVPQTPAGVAHRYDLYFRTGGSAPSGPTGPHVAVPDYATDAYGHGWDFDRGDFEAIDTWGDKPEYIRARRVEDGLLKLDVSGDAYFIWGAMWGNLLRSQRPVSIDLARYPVLEMRLRQSVPEAEWKIFGRPGRGESLVQYGFHVSGTAWQTVRIDLRRDARWHGVLTALRIDPCKYQDAHVEFDWVRLLSLASAVRSAVEVRREDPAAARVQIDVATLAPQAGAEQTVTVRATAADGAPLAGQPVRLELAPGSGGEIARSASFPALAVNGGMRAITDNTGAATFRYRASRRAVLGADTLTATAEFSPAPPARRRVTPLAGPPVRYTVSPAQPAILPRGVTRLPITVRLADAWGNPVPGGGRPLTWSAPGGRLHGAPARTAPDGSARAVLECDPEVRWVVTVGVRDAAGFAGEFAPVCVLPTGPRPDPVRLLPNGYFGVGNKAWLPLGGFYANWVGTPSPDGEWNRLVSFVDATDAQIVAWLKLLKASGVTAERFMLRAHRPNGMEPMDIGGRVNPGLFAKFLHYLDLARPFGFRFQLVLHEDYTKPLYFDGDALERFALPRYTAQELDRLPAYRRRFLRDRRLIDDIAAKYTDPDVIACQDRYAREIVGLLKGNPVVFGYELENEMVGCPASWVNHQLAVIRSVDPTVPICVSHGGGGVFTADPAWWRARTGIDYYTPHLYPDPPSTSPQIDYGLAVDVLMRYSRLAHPAFLGESAGDQFAQHPDRDTRRWTMRDIIWFSLTNGAPGCFFWNARASEVAEFRLAHDIASRIDWATFRRRPASVVATVSHPLANDRWFETREGRQTYEAMAQYAHTALENGADLDFALRAQPGFATVNGSRYTPPEALRSDVRISAGFQCRPLVRRDGREALLYVRNVAGVVRWESAGDPRTTQYLRRRAVAPLTLTVALPGHFVAEIWDLDTQAHQRRAIASGEPLDLGVTDHDFAILLRRR